jgi:hypothetical protein
LNPRRSTILIAFGFVILCSVVRPALAQRTGPYFSPPAKLSLSRATRKTFPHFYNTAFHGEVLVTEEFYPIGWSKDGKFAYYSEPGDEACDCYFAKVVILDLVNDKLLWSFKYDGSDDTERKGAPKSIRALWGQNRKLFSDKLRAYGIEPGSRFALGMFPFAWKGTRLMADVKLKEKTDDDSRLYGTVTQASVQLTSRREGKKTVWDHAFSEDETFPLDVDVVGYVKSPFEDRIAMILIEVYRGYEGPPHATNIEVAGASLSSGFK